MDSIYTEGRYAFWGYNLPDMKIPNGGTQIHEKFWVSAIYFIRAFPRRKLLGIQRYNDIISFQISAKMREISACQQKTDFMGMLADTWASRTDACHQFSPLVHTEDWKCWLLIVKTWLSAECSWHNEDWSKRTDGDDSLRCFDENGQSEDAGSTGVSNHETTFTFIILKNCFTLIARYILVEPAANNKELAKNIC